MHTHAHTHIHGCFEQPIKFCIAAKEFSISNNLVFQKYTDYFSYFHVTVGGPNLNNHPSVVYTCTRPQTRVITRIS